MSGRHRAPHTRSELKRVYTGPNPADFYDAPTGSSECTCDRDADHREVTSREPYRPNG